MISSTKMLLYKCMNSIFEHSSSRIAEYVGLFVVATLCVHLKKKKIYKIAKKTCVVKTNKPLAYILTIYIYIYWQGR